MNLIKKYDLFYKDYSWTALKGDNPKISGEPDRSLLNRKEGYEVLYFVNKLCEIWNLKNISSAVKIEKMIRIEVPTELHSQENIKLWIKNNWKNSKF